MRRCLVLLLLAFVVSHASAQERHEDSPALYVWQIQPGPRIEAIYHEVERCSGLTGDYPSLEWWAVDQPITGARNSRTGSSWGWWLIRKDGHRMVVLVSGDSTEVSHEILHDILWVSGWRPDPTAPETPAKYHPEPPFGVCAQRGVR